MRLPSISIPAGLVTKGAIPAAFVLALGSGSTLYALEQFEGNVLHVYADRLAYNLPTYCAGATDPNAAVGTKLSSDFCDEVNKATVMDYGLAVLACTEWRHLTPSRLTGLTMFAINVGKAGACGSEAVKAINRGQVEEGCRLLAYKPSGAPNWSYAGGNFVAGLHNRRKAEMAMCLS